MHEQHHTGSELEASVKREVAQAVERSSDSVQTETEFAVEGVRKGSPFRAGSASVNTAAGGAMAIPAFDPRHDGATNFDIGITASTAFGGLLAAYTILPFAAVSALTFPTGAIMISGLGLVLSIFAFAAQRPVLTSIALFMHLLTGMLGYFQML